MGDYPVCVVFSYVVPFAGQMRVYVTTDHAGLCG